MFCKDDIHFSFYANKIFSLLLAQLTCIYSPLIYPPRCQIMADQTHCHICERPLRKGGIWCVISKAYNHVSCSGLQSSKFYYDGFSCIQCSPENFAKKSPTLQTDQQALPSSQLKKKHHRQHLKQTYCPTQHNLIHRP